MQYRDTKYSMQRYKIFDTEIQNIQYRDTQYAIQIYKIFNTEIHNIQYRDTQYSIQRYTIFNTEIHNIQYRDTQYLIYRIQYSIYGIEYSIIIYAGYTESQTENTIFNTKYTEYEKNNNFLKLFLKLFNLRTNFKISLAFQV